MAAMIPTLRKGVVRLLIIALVMVISLAIGWAGLHQAEKFTEMYHWVIETKGFWLVWRLCLYATLGWGGWKIWQVVKCRPEYRAPLMRIMVASLLLILLGEYALSGTIEVTQ
ncbi:hypothetical protein PXH59_01900 [Xenorhabdus sp. SF857]|uniref:hypothetical protein n=1 Tax=Xenorhabdus bakwenae TaxID=3026967 RepID=UPI0025580A0F|nr:hypothetical protein [Xenorhabdus sp. SF857]WFQ79970.1 hypothetical protein PXH59_01900 [Xenorhabdus sp. SF857]